MDQLGLNDHHQEILTSYMRFAKYQRTKRLRAIDAAFDDLRDCRLVEETYNVDEVKDHLADLENIIREDVENELRNAAHTNVLLMQQFFQQAEKWHLKLHGDISELENAELLENVKKMEESEMSKPVKKPLGDTKYKTGKLVPIEDRGPEKLLQMEIERLREENERLRDRLKTTEEKTASFLEEKSRMRDQLDEMRTSSGRKDGQADTDELEKRVNQLKCEMEKTASSSTTKEALLGDELTSAKHELLRVHEQLETAEQQLEKKFAQTSVYQNLKKMLGQKNNVIKDLRTKLAKYEGASND